MIKSMPNATHFAWHSCPVGEILLTARDGSLTSLHLLGRRSGVTISDDWIEGGSVLDAARAQLDAYFAGRSRGFDLPIRPDGTPFQRRVWDELCKIPYSETISYAELARRVGKDGAARAVESEHPLEGYRGSRPVRTGNAAIDQLQLDTYGELLQTAWVYARAGNRIDRDLAAQSQTAH